MFHAKSTPVSDVLTSKKDFIVSLFFRNKGIKESFSLIEMKNGDFEKYLGKLLDENTLWCLYKASSKHKIISVKRTSLVFKLNLPIK